MLLSTLIVILYVRYFFSQTIQGDTEEDHEAGAALASALAALEGKKIEPVQKRLPSAKSRS